MIAAIVAVCTIASEPSVATHVYVYMPPDHFNLPIII